MPQCAEFFAGWDVQGQLGTPGNDGGGRAAGVGIGGSLRLNGTCLPGPRDQRNLEEPGTGTLSPGIGYPVTRSRQVSPGTRHYRAT